MLIPLVLFLGLTAATAVIAVWADNLGKKLGKKRVSLFGLRPRTTATLLTVASSWGIMLFTLVALLTVVTPLRNALFRYERERAANQQLRAEAVELGRENQRIGSLNASALAQFRQANAQLDEVRGELDVARDEIDEVQEEAEDAQTRAQGAERREKAAQRGETEARRREQTAQRREQTARRAEVSALRAANTAARVASQAQQRATQARERADQARRRAELARREAEQARREREVARREVTAAQREVGAARRAVGLAESDAETARQATQTARNQLQVTRADVASTQADLRAAQAQVNATNIELEATQKNLTGAQQQLSETEQRLKLAQQSLERASETFLSTASQLLDAERQKFEAQRQAQEAEQLLATLLERVEALRADRILLLQEATQLAEGDVRLGVGQTLAQRVIPRDQSPTQIEAALRLTLADARAALPRVLPEAELTLLQLARVGDEFVPLPEATIFSELTRRLATSDDDVAVRLVAVRNFSSREPSVQAQFVIVPVRLVLPQDRELAQITLDGSLSDARLFSQLLDLVERGRTEATRLGANPPQSLQTPNFFADDTNERLFEALRRADELNTTVRVRLLVARNTTSIEPVPVRFEVEPLPAFAPTASSRQNEISSL